MEQEQLFGECVAKSKKKEKEEEDSSSSSCDSEVEDYIANCGSDGDWVVAEEKEDGESGSSDSDKDTSDVTQEKLESALKVKEFTKAEYDRMRLEAENAIGEEIPGEEGPEMSEGTWVAIEKSQKAKQAYEKQKKTVKKMLREIVIVDPEDKDSGSKVVEHETEQLRQWARRISSPSVVLTAPKRGRKGGRKVGPDGFKNPTKGYSRAVRELWDLVDALTELVEDDLIPYTITPPLDRIQRKRATELAQYFGVVCKSKGSGERRSLTITKTRLSSVPLRSTLGQAIMKLCPKPFIEGEQDSNAAAAAATEPSEAQQRQKGKGKNKKSGQSPPPHSVSAAPVLVGQSADPLWEDESNIGRAMLMKLGWKIGTGLGVEGDGITEPITAVVKRDKSGLGHGND